MTTETFTPTPAQTISGTGPYDIDHPYREGALVLSVIKDDERTELDPADYVVAPLSSETTGAVTLTSGAATTHDGGKLYIRRETDAEQGWEGVRGNREAGLEAQLDYLTQAVQDSREAWSKALRFETSVNPGVAVEGRALIFDENLDPVPGPTADDIADAQPNAAIAQAAAQEAAALATPYVTRADAEAATVTAPVTRIAVLTADGFVLNYLRDATGTALTTADGANWSPADFNTPDHFRTAAATDDTAAFAAAMAFRPGVQLLPRDYTVEDIDLINGCTIHGATSSPLGYSAGYAGSGSRIVFSGGSGGCIKDGSPSDQLLHATLGNLTFYTTEAYDWLVDLETVVGLRMNDINMEATHNDTGGIRTQKINPGDSSWVLKWDNVRVRVSDTSTKSPLDIDMSDGSIMGSTFGGGIGSFMRGTGGVKVIGNLFNNASADALTVSVETESKSQHIIALNQIEEWDGNGLVINGDADDTLTEDHVCLTVMGNTYRGRGAATGSDIKLVNSSGGTLKGGLIYGNHHATALPKIDYDPDTWKNLTILPGAMDGGSGVNTFVDGDYRQSPLVLDQGGAGIVHTGTTDETTLKTVTIPGGTLRAQGRIDARVMVTCNNDANAKYLRVYFGGTEFVEVNLNLATGGWLETTIYNLTEATQRGTNRTSFGQGEETVLPAMISGTLDTTADQDVTITAELADSSDQITIVGFDISVVPHG